jgi:hypothetical protein
MEQIYGYSRAQAIEDGELVDVTTTAKEAGFTVPVAVTRAVWVGAVKVPEGVRLQDEAGRLWDILWMLRNAIKGARGPRVEFSVYVRNHNGPDFAEADRRTLISVIGPGDTPAPVITIMTREDE